MLKLYTLILLLFFSLNLYPQAPFTTLAMEPIHIVKENNKYRMFDMKKAKENGASLTTDNGKTVKTTDPKEDVDFFKTVL